MDMEELQRRRQERQERRQQQARQRRALLIRLGIAGAVLLGVALLILLLGRSRPEDPQQTQTLPPLTTQGTLPPTSQVEITAVGDLNVTEQVIASGGMAYDYTATFLDALPVLSRGDITLVNLEGTLCGAPYGGEIRSAPQSLMEALADTGVDLVQTANSYAIKKGVATLGMTLANLRAAGLEGVGTYANAQQAKEKGGYTLCLVNGVKIAFIAFTKGMDGMALPAGSESCVNLLYTDYATNYHQVDTDGIRALVRRAQQQEPDIIVALVHWGSEYNDTHSKTQTQIRDTLLEAGVDAIIGSHPHYVQPIEFDPEAGTLVAYSLGDFLGDAQRSGTEYSIALHLQITKDNVAGTAAITGYSYTPLFTRNTPEGLRVVRLEQALQAYEQGCIGRISQAEQEAMTYALERIKARITPEAE